MQKFLTSHNFTNVQNFVSGNINNEIVFFSDPNQNKKGFYVANMDEYFYCSDQVSNEDLLSYGVEWDITQGDSYLTRIGNPLLHKSLPVQSSYRGCIWSIEEQKIVYYLDPNDWSKKEDGTSSKLDGTDGVVRIHIPRFYGKSVEDGNKRQVRISMSYIDDTYKVIPEMVIDAYRPTLHSGRFESVVNNTEEYRGGNGSTAYDGDDPCKSTLCKPRTNMSRATARNYATAASSQLMSYNIYKWIFYWNYVIEYANFDCQETYRSNLTSDGYRQGGLGNGVTTANYDYWTNYNNTNPLTPCGYCNEFGNGTGTKTMSCQMPTTSGGSTMQSYTFQVPRWRGFDNPFGDIWTNVDGALIDTPLAGASDSSVTPTCYIFDNPENFTDSLDDISNADRTFTLPHSGGYIKQIDLNTNGDIVPLSTGGGSIYYHCDYYYVDYNDTPETLLVGGRADNGSSAGLGYFSCNRAVGGGGPRIGFRTLNLL